MIFTSDKGLLTAKQEVNFKLEKDLQRLVERNIGSIFNLKFVATEFAIEGYRFDTVAFNFETNSFVIIEYKRGKNESLVDQGYAYLYTLLDRRAEFVLLFNEVFKKSKSIKDFEWSQTRIMFISPKFTDYQKNATAFMNMPFELYEIKQYEDGIIAVSEINTNKTLKIENEEMKKTSLMYNEKIEKVSREIVVYTEKALLDNGGDFTREIYANIKERILELGDIKVDPKKLYVAFKGKSNICDIIIRKKYLAIFLNLKDGLLHDPENVAEKVKDIGHWGNGDYRVTIDSFEKIDYLMALIRQSYKINR